MTEIGGSAFSGCTGLTEVTIPNSVTTIGSSAFNSCTGLTSITIPNSVTSIGSQAFRGCTGLTQFEVADGNEYYCSVDGVLYTKDMTTLVQFPCASPLLPSFDIPEGVTTIGNYAFNYCRSMTSVTIPESVVTIGEWAFEYCSRLTSIIIPNSVTEIGSYAFWNCTGLTGELIIPNSVTEIGSEAFSYCQGLTSVTIGESVTEIGSYAFENCWRLTSVTIGNSVATIGSRAFRDCTGLTSIYSLNPEPPTCYSDNYGVFYNMDTSNCTLYVPIGSKEKYATADQWQDFLNIVEMDMTPVNSIVANGNAEPVGYYTTDGKQVPQLQRGVNIIRYSDGTARKVLVK